MDRTGGNTISSSFSRFFPYSLQNTHRTGYSHALCYMNERRRMRTNFFLGEWMKWKKKRKRKKLTDELALLFFSSFFLNVFFGRKCSNSLEMLICAIRLSFLLPLEENAIEFRAYVVKKMKVPPVHVGSRRKLTSVRKKILLSIGWYCCKVGYFLLENVSFPNITRRNNPFFFFFNIFSV